MLWLWRETTVLKKIIAATALITAAVPAVADVITYDCTVKGGEKQGWIDDRLILSVDIENKTAMAFNGTINYYNGEPIAADIKVMRSGKYRVRWSIEVTEAKPRSVRANYEVQLEPGANKLSLFVRFPLINAVERPRGNGACKILKGETLF